MHKGSREALKRMKMEREEGRVFGEPGVCCDWLLKQEGLVMGTSLLDTETGKGVRWSRDRVSRLCQVWKRKHNAAKGKKTF